MLEKELATLREPFCLNLGAHNQKRLVGAVPHNTLFEDFWRNDGWF